MGTVLAKEMGLPISKILCGVNENTEFSDYMSNGKYVVSASKKSPSSAMIVSHPSNLARLIDFYGGHMFDERDTVTRKVVREGVIDKEADLNAMRKDLFSVSIDNEQHYKTMKEVYAAHKVVLDPHGAVGWRALEVFLLGKEAKAFANMPAVIYETADPGKFPEDVTKAIGIVPLLPAGMKKQAELKERIFSINSAPDSSSTGMKLSDAQLEEAKKKIKEIFS